MGSDFTLDPIHVDALIGYAGVGVSVFILLMTNPDIWTEGRQRCLPRWFAGVPLFFLVSLLVLLATPASSRPWLTLVGWFSAVVGTLLVLVSYAVFLYITASGIAARRTIHWGARILRKLGLSITRTPRAEAERP